MVLHVGISIFNKEVAVYNSTNNRSFILNLKTNFTHALNIIDDVSPIKIDIVFKEIKENAKEELGCACIFLRINEENDIRKYFIKKGMEAGFSKVHIIDEDSATYLNFISRIECKPKNGDIILIFERTRYWLWEKCNSKARLIEYGYFTERYLVNIMSKLNPEKQPSLIISDERFTKRITIEKIFPSVKCYFCRIDRSYAHACLIKARIMAEDSDVMEFEELPYFKDIIWVGINKKEVLYLNYTFWTFPIFKLRIVQIDSKEEKLEVELNCDERKEDLETIKASAEMLRSGRILFIFKMDENGIISVNCSEVTIKNIKHELNVLYHTQVPTKIIYDIPQIDKTKIAYTKAVGIDLGTSRCCTAVNRRNGMETVAIDSCERQMPSYVAFDEEQPKCGHIVFNRLQNYAKFTVFDSKRIIGRDFEDIKIDKNWPFKVFALHGHPIIRVEQANHFMYKNPEDIATILLKHIKKINEEYQRYYLDEVVIAIPAAFTNKQKIATHVAGILAGWEDITLLPEPIAAAISYFIDKPILQNANILLFDLGGGTLDICIFKGENNKLEIIGNAGDTNLGGRDFDQLLIEHFGNILKNDYAVDVTQKDKQKYRLFQKCIEIKHSLSFQTEESLDVYDFSVNAEAFVDITRQNFEKMAKILLDKIKFVILKCLKAANINTNQINKILQVGGGCRMPMIKIMLEEIFPQSEHCCDINPDEVVAIGAAYYSYYLQRYFTPSS